MSYTSEMEKAMHGAHGVGYEVYKRKHEVRMQVEMQREKDYRESRRMIAALDRKVHANI
ncbi:conserved hypothetical protein [Bacillus sp. 349Y]|jgi:hypothetical protein|nr:conserved hypothetical protein [Bacillus sp. 349Y]